MLGQALAAGDVPDADRLALLRRLRERDEPAAAGGEGQADRPPGREPGAGLDVAHHEEVDRLGPEPGAHRRLGPQRGGLLEQAEPADPAVRHVRVPDHLRRRQELLAHRRQGLALLDDQAVALQANLHIGERRDRQDGDRRGRRDGRDPGVPPREPPGAARQADPPGADRLVVEEPGQVLGEVARRLVTVRRPLGQQLQDDRLQVARDPRVEHPGGDRLVRRDLLDQLGGAAALEGGAEGEQLVEGRAQAVEVGPAVDRADPGLLGAHVARGAEQAVVLGQARVGEPSGEPEVGDPDEPAAVDQEVRRLDVAVDHAPVVGVPERLGGLAADLGDPPVIGRAPGRHVRRRLVLVVGRDRVGQAAVAEAVAGPLGAEGLAQRRPRAGDGPRAEGRACSSSCSCSFSCPRPRPQGGDPAGAGTGGGRAVPAQVPDHPVEPAPLDPLHRVVAESAHLADVEDRDDVRVVQPGGGPRLVEEPPPAVRIGGGVRPQHLQGDGAVEADVDGLVDDAHPPPAQLADDPVAGDPAARLQPRPRPVPVRRAHESPDQGQALERGEQVVAEVGVTRRERLGLGGAARLRQGEVGLDRLADALVVVGRFGFRSPDHRGTSRSRRGGLPGTA